MSVRLGSIVIGLLLSSSASVAQETIGPWYVVAAPVSAVEIVGGGPGWTSLNVVNAQVDVNQAFSGFGILDDGFAGGAPGTMIEVRFAPGTLVNTPGDDLVMLDALYGCHDYAFSTEYDGFTASVAREWWQFEDTGIERSYYTGSGGTYHARVAGAGVDLSSIGVPPGASVERVRFWGLDTGLNFGIAPLGIGVACPCDVETYCAVSTNSTGAPAHLFFHGSLRVSDDDVRLTAFPVPHQMFVYYYGTTRTETPFGNGYLCVGAPVTRLGPPQLANGQMAVKQISVSGFFPGSYHFQCWFRDPSAGGAMFNTSNGITIPLVP